jgi:hypothetical protein
LAKATRGLSYKYPFLQTARTDVDWRHVNPVLLRQLNAIGKQLGKVIVIFSGYRSDRYSAAVGGFAGDPHTRHMAVDATIGGKPIGQVVSAKIFKQYGLRSGNVPNFYHGKPDPEHVDLVGTVNANQGSQPAAPSAPEASTGPAEGAAALPDYTGGVQTGPQPGGPPQALDPGTIQAGNFNSRVYAKVWQQVASQPMSDPSTAWYAKQANGA